MSRFSHLLDCICMSLSLSHYFSGLYRSTSIVIVEGLGPKAQGVAVFSSFLWLSMPTCPCCEKNRLLEPQNARSWSLFWHHSAGRHIAWALWRCLQLVSFAGIASSCEGFYLGIAWFSWASSFSNVEVRPGQSHNGNPCNGTIQLLMAQYGFVCN